MEDDTQRRTDLFWTIGRLITTSGDLSRDLAVPFSHSGLPVPAPPHPSKCPRHLCSLEGSTKHVRLKVWWLHCLWSPETEVPEMEAPFPPEDLYWLSPPDVYPGASTLVSIAEFQKYLHWLIGSCLALPLAFFCPDDESWVPGHCKFFLGKNRNLNFFHLVQGAPTFLEWSLSC